MDVFAKTKILTEAGDFDSCGPKMCGVSLREGLGGVYHAKAEHKTCRLFKTLMTNSCSYDCNYCINRAGCAKKKVGYTPKELAKVFLHLSKTLDVYGLFLSSGVSGSADATTERMLEAVRQLRYKHHFNGYIHFKVLPGTSYDLIKQAASLSNRLSVNIEAPNEGHLQELSSCKSLRSDILRRQAWVKRMGVSHGQTTQMIVTDDASDKSVLRMSHWQYDSMELERVYYSAFSPVKDTPMQREKAVSKLRETRLYNVDFLTRMYGYSYKEFFSIMDDGMLPREDPKLVLARQTFDSPVDITESSYEELIRVPGIGPVTAKRLLTLKKPVSSFCSAKRLGVNLSKASPFIKIGRVRQTTLV